MPAPEGEDYDLWFLAGSKNRILASGSNGFLRESACDNKNEGNNQLS